MTLKWPTHIDHGIFVFTTATALEVIWNVFFHCIVWFILERKLQWFRFQFKNRWELLCHFFETQFLIEVANGHWQACYYKWNFEKKLLCADCYDYTLNDLGCDHLDPVFGTVTSIECDNHCASVCIEYYLNALWTENKCVRNVHTLETMAVEQLDNIFLSLILCAFKIYQCTVVCTHFFNNPILK